MCVVSGVLRYKGQDANQWTGDTGWTKTSVVFVCCGGQKDDEEEKPSRQRSSGLSL